MHISRSTLAVCGIAILFSALRVQADAWQGNLEGGGVVRVDPETRKPTFYYNGGATQLWDGVHRLENGSVVIVRDGAVVPSESMLGTWSAEAPAPGRSATRQCERLMRKVCGFKAECAGERPCDLARQLGRLEQDALAQAPQAPLSDATLECRKGLADTALFPACERVAGGRDETPCGRLVLRVCGADDRCRDTAACGPARQLLRQEYEERLDAEDPDAATASGTQCTDAMKNAFFAACP